MGPDPKPTSAYFGSHTFGARQMRDKLAKKLADPALYEPERLGEMATWQKKYAEVMEGLDRAEGMWLKAQEKLEAAA